MTNKSKQKGTRNESNIEGFLNAQKIRCRRIRQGGSKDKGDIELWDFPFIIEAKDEKAYHLSEYIKEANEEGENSGKIGIAWIKKPRTQNPGNYYVLMDGYAFIKILRLLDGLYNGS